MGLDEVPLASRGDEDSPMLPPNLADDLWPVRRLSSRSRGEVARYVAEPAPPPKFLRTMKADHVLPSEVGQVSTAATAGGHTTASAPDAPPLDAPPPSEPSELEPESSLANAYDAATGRWMCPRGCGYTCAKRQGLGGHKRNCPVLQAERAEGQPCDSYEVLEAEAVDDAPMPSSAEDEEAGQLALPETSGQRGSSTDAPLSSVQSSVQSSSQSAEEATRGMAQPAAVVEQSEGYASGEGELDAVDGASSGDEEPLSAGLSSTINQAERALDERQAPMADSAAPMLHQPRAEFVWAPQQWAERAPRADERSVVHEEHAPMVLEAAQVYADAEAGGEAGGRAFPEDADADDADAGPREGAAMGEARRLCSTRRA